MKSLVKFLGLLTAVSLSSLSYASVTFTGVAVKNGVGVAVGDRAIFIVDEAGLGFGSINLLEGNSISESLTFGSNFSVIGSVTVSSFIGVNVGSPAAFNLGNGVDTGDRFAVVVFSASTDSAVAGDTYTIWTDPTWLVPADSATVGFANPAAGGFLQLVSSSAAFSKVIQSSAIPEPSSFAALAGLSILGLVATRRRRSA